jgi:DNA-binding winged helix-turn-helix (wHTH) protein
MPLYEFAGFRLDADKRLLLQRDGAAVGLTPKGYETLAYLVEHSGAVVEKEQMIRAIWPTRRLRKTTSLKTSRCCGVSWGKDEVSTGLSSLFRGEVINSSPL